MSALWLQIDRIRSFFSNMDSDKRWFPWWKEKPSLVDAKDANEAVLFMLRVGNTICISLRYLSNLNMTVTNYNAIKNKTVASDLKIVDCSFIYSEHVSLCEICRAYNRLRTNDIRPRFEVKHSFCNHPSVIFDIGKQRF